MKKKEKEKNLLKKGVSFLLFCCRDIFSSHEWRPEEWIPLQEEEQVST